MSDSWVGEGKMALPPAVVRAEVYTDKKENQILLIYKEKIQNGAIAKSNMSNGLLINGEILAHFLIY